jgi:hypothetical protein
MLNAYLTRTGTRKLSAVSSQVRELEARLLSGLTSDERQNLNRALPTVIDNVTPHWQRPDKTTRHIDTVDGGGRSCPAR